MATEAEDGDDYDLYHYDFTTASDWEIFIARLEEVIHQWKLHHKRKLPRLKRGQFAGTVWQAQSEKLMFADVEFTMTRHFTKIESVDGAEDAASSGPVIDDDDDEPLTDMMRLEHDYIPVWSSGPYLTAEETQPHVIARWYGLREFVVLAPVQGSIMSESKLKVLLSSLCIAVNNTNCEVPMFVRALELWQKFYIGIYEGRGVRAKFEMIHLHRVPQQCKHLTGLLSLFKSKVGSGAPVEPVAVSARFMYTLQDWTHFEWSQHPPDLDLFHGEVGFEELGKLPFGAVSEPISSLILYTTWPDVMETVVVDSESYTDFEPTQAPLWSLSAKKDSGLSLLLTSYLEEFLNLCMNNKTNKDYLGDLTKDSSSGDYFEPFSQLMESRIPTLSDLLGQYTSPKRQAEGPISYQILMPILCYLFPDAEKTPTQPEYKSEEESGGVQRMKTCRPDSLVWRLALVMAHALSPGGPKAAAHIWHEFSQVLRYYWSTSSIIPGVGSGFPDTKTCLLHQKLQMINCCILRKKKREEAALNPQESDESEEEFFDCTDSECAGEGEDAKQKPKHSLWNTPTGRLSRHGTLKLIKTGQSLYIPHTQGETPKTEDQVEEDAEVLLQLGSNAEGSQLRAKMMSASLLSDMESFKAANPGAELEDFIRWYSPRDWIEEDELDEFGQKKGQLSARMLLPGNTWLEVWEAAKPVPARRQKRLFDDTREAEIALHFVESRPPAAAAQLLLPVLFHVALDSLTHHAQHITGLTALTSILDKASKKMEVLTRQSPFDIRRYQDLCTELNYAEEVIAQFKSLEQKLCPEPDETMKNFITGLVSQPEVEVPGGPHGPVASRIKSMFTEAHKASQMLYDTDPASAQGETWSPLQSGSVLPTAQEREFILRCKAPRPSPFSKVLPHRLSVMISKNEVFMAGAFSEDTLFQ